MVKDEIFRAYDIRGIYPEDIDPELSRSVARAMLRMLEGKRIAVSMDVRLSNEALTKPLLDELVAGGAQVWYIGVAPTPLMYFTIAKYGLDGGIAVSASHNPPQWNGYKLCGKEGKVFGLGEGLEKIKDIIDREDFGAATGGGIILEKRNEVMADYEKFIKENSRMERKLRIGIDPGNGTCCGFASGIMRRAGQEVVAINDEPDGRFPSRDPEPKPETIKELCSMVKESGLDFGVAFDGDGDRAIFVDDRGVVLGGDRTLALFSDNMIEPGDKVVYEVSCSDAVKEVVERRGGVAVLTGVGRSNLENKMLEVGARMGGEISGHMYFRESYYFDDAFFAAAKMVELLSSKGRKLSELLEALPAYTSRLVEFNVSDEMKFKVVDAVARSLKKRGGKLITMDGVKLVTDRGWFIIRASNTGPKVKMVAEGKDDRLLEEMLKAGREEFEKAYKEVSAGA